MCTQCSTNRGESTRRDKRRLRGVETTLIALQWLDYYCVTIIEISIYALRTVSVVSGMH